MLYAAYGAEIRSMGRVRWFDVNSTEPMTGPSPICAFILSRNDRHRKLSPDLKLPLEAR